mgnify:CR=1 FL=1
MTETIIDSNQATQRGEIKRLDKEVKRISHILAPYFGLKKVSRNYSVELSTGPYLMLGESIKNGERDLDNRKPATFCLAEGVEDYEIAHEVGHFLHFNIDPRFIPPGLGFHRNSFGWVFIETVATKSELVYLDRRDPFTDDPNRYFTLYYLANELGKSWRSEDHHKLNEYFLQLKLKSNNTEITLNDPLNFEIVENL